LLQCERTMPLMEASLRAQAARANARRFAERIEEETDEVVISSLRQMAASWAQVAEDQEFVIEMEKRAS
jgi:hypothetical protein